jgi:hypothetical protein
VPLLKIKGLRFLTPMNCESRASTGFRSVDAQCANEISVAKLPSDVAVLVWVAKVNRNCAGQGCSIDQTSRMQKARNVNPRCGLFGVLVVELRSKPFNQDEEAEGSTLFHPEQPLNINALSVRKRQSKRYGHR